MTTAPVRVGIDYHTGHLLSARVESDETGTRITVLSSGIDPDVLKADPPGEAQITLAVPDSDVVVKHLHLPKLPAAVSLDRAVQCELSSSLLDDPGDFSFGALPGASEGHALGFITRRRRLAGLVKSVLPDADLNMPALKFKMRAVALARGYVQFCQREDSGLVCLLDFGSDEVSAALVQGETIVDVAYLCPGRFNLSEETSARQMVAELKTVISFKVASAVGNTAPPEGPLLLVSGEAATLEVRDVLERQFRPPVKVPEVIKTLLGDNLDPVAAPENFLVALGLTVN